MDTLKTYKSVYILFALICINMNTAYSQLKGPKYDERLLFKNVRGVNLSFLSQSWELKDTSSSFTVAQVSTPLVTSIPITSRLLLTVSGSMATSTNDAPEILKDTSQKPTKIENKNTLKGLSDSRLSLSYVVPGDKLWINGGLSLPTGKSKLTSEEFSVSRMVSQAGLGFRVPVAGQGVNSNLGFAYAYSYSRRIVIGFGASSTFKGAFEPVIIETNIDSVAAPKVNYNPGEDFSINSGIDYTSANKDQRISSDLTFSYYLPDQLNEKNTFQVGSRINALFLFSQKFGPTNNTLLVRGRYRFENKIFKSDSSNTSSTYPSAKQIEMQYNISTTPWQIFTISGNFEYKYHTADQFPLGNNIIKTGNVNMLSYGIDVNYPITDWILLMFATKKGSGKLVVEGTEYDANGLDFGFGVRVSI